MSHKVVLNGIAANNSSSAAISMPDGSAPFVTGRCHRLPHVKFSINSLVFLDNLNIHNHVHFLVGPKNNGIIQYSKKHPRTCVKYLGKIDDQKKKNELLRSFDLYFYDTYGPEGASVAILEGLAAGIPVLCKPLGGNKELVIDGKNGFHYAEFKQTASIIHRLYNNPNELRELKQSVKEDFDRRLSVDRCVNEYWKLIEKKL